MQATTEWKRGHIWDILATVQPHSLGTGDKCSPQLVSEFCFGKVQQCSILRDPTTGDLKSHHLQAGVTALSVPPPPFLSAVHEKKFVFVCFLGHSWPLRGGGGGGGQAPLSPPPPPSIGSGTVGRRLNITAKIE